jgi:hypothetical protein
MPFRANTSADEREFLVSCSDIFLVFFMRAKLSIFITRSRGFFALIRRVRVFHVAKLQPENVFLFFVVDWRADEAGKYVRPATVLGLAS